MTIVFSEDAEPDNQKTEEKLRKISLAGKPAGE
jgi:hypothetical protein